MSSDTIGLLAASVFLLIAVPEFRRSRAHEPVIAGVVAGQGLGGVCQARFV